MLIALVILNNKKGEIFKMAKFKVTIDTSKYKPCDKFATNRLMYAMDGWTTTESSYKEVLFRLRTFFGRDLYEDEWSKWGKQYEKWLSKKSNHIIINNDIYSIVLPGIPMNYIDFDKYINEIKSTGKVIIELDKTFDIRQSGSSYLKGCFMKIEKLERQINGKYN